MKAFDSNDWGITEITDSRHFDDSGRVIPGSGEAIHCAACGRDIFVHVGIINADTMESAIIGKDCMAKLNIRHIKYITSYGHRFTAWNVKNA